MHPEQALRSFFRARPGLNGQQLLLAVSGGPDSAALAVVGASVAPEFGLRLTIAHLDHALRPDSAQDAQLVAQLGQRLGIAVLVERADVAAYAREHRLSSEAAARAVRYRFLAHVARDTGAAGAVTGHTADDQAETVLLHLVRGAGPLGWSGMRPDRVLRLSPDAPPLRVLRPLLATTRAETLAYCEERGVGYAVDATNRDVRFTRNRVRHEVLPLLERLNPAVREALCRASVAAAALADLVEVEAERLWPRLARVEGSGVGFRVEALRALPEPVQVAVLERAVARLGEGEPGPMLSARHLAATLRLLGDSGEERAVHWPGGLHVTRAGAELWVGDRPTPPALAASGYSLAVPGGVVLPSGARLVAALRDAPCPAQDASPHHLDVARHAAGDLLMVRGPRPGDRLRRRGLGGTKKMQDLLTDAKVPRPDRPAVPLVVGRGGLLWVVGLAVDERAAVLAEGAPVVCLRHEPAQR